MGADAAHVMSRAMTREACSTLDREFIGEGEVEGEAACGLGAAVQRLNGQLLEVQAIGESGTCTYEQVDRKWLLLNKWVEEEASKKMVDDAIGSEFDSARLKALQAQSAGAFLEGVPSSAGGTMLNGNEFRSRVGRRLGRELCDEGMCPACGNQMDRFGAHPEGCMCGGDVTRRHNGVNYLVYKQCQSAGIRPELEKSKLLSGAKSQRDLGRRRPADTLINAGADVKTGKKRNMLQVALDVGVVNPQAPLHVSNAARGTLKAAD